jgi:putative DNA primase/helicase
MSGKFDTDAIKASVSIANVIGSYVNLKQDGNEFKGLCPFHGEKTPSFHVVPEKGFYHCFGCGVHGDVLDFVTSHTGVSFKEACEALGGEKLPAGKPIKPLPKKDRIDPYKGYSPKIPPSELKPGLPVELVNPKREGKLWKGACPISVHPYHTAKGDLHGYVIRLEIDGTKLTPMVRYTDQGWTMYPFDDPRPLYGLESIIKTPDRQTLVVEGEKAADAIRRLVGDKVNVVSWCGGTQSISRTDWKPLNGKNVVIIPDRDTPGLKAAHEILEKIKPESITMIYPPSKYPKGWDVADRVWSHDGEFYDWCKKNKVNKLPEKYNESIDPPAKEIVKESSAEVIPASAIEIGHTLEGKHSIDGQIIAQFFQDKMIYDAPQNQWYRYDKIWYEVASETVKKLIAKIMNTQFTEGYQLSQLTGTYGMTQIYLTATNEDGGDSGNVWETDTHLLPMANGVLDLKTKKLMPHDPKLYLDWMLPHVWDDQKAEYPIITKFLHSLAGGDSHKIQTLLCFLAAVLRGMSDSQKFLEIIGTPGTGKSTFIKLACELVGDANILTTSLEQLQNNKFETANLYGKRLAIITDADKYGGSVEVFKAATGKDPLRSEKKNKQQGRSFVFHGMFIVAANQPVQYRDQSTAMMRRRVPLHIDHRLDKKNSDPDLLEKIIKELPGFIHDLVDIPEEYIESVLTDANDHRADTDARSLCETNVVAEWLDENVIADAIVTTKIGNAQREGHKILNSEDWLYPNHVSWCETTGKKGHNALNTFRRTVSEILNKQGVEHEIIRRGDGMSIKGIRIRLEVDYSTPSLLRKLEIDK